MRKIYSKSFKTEICLRVLSKEKTVGSVSKEYGIEVRLSFHCNLWAGIHQRL